jgi:alpha-L-fucosidase 2
MDAFPLGNGRLGAMHFGGVATDRLALNEDTLYSGAPREWNNPGARAHLAVVRKLVIENKDYEAADLECRGMDGPWNEAYQPLGDLLVDVEHGDAATKYRRTLDLDSALDVMEYQVGGVGYRRETFASFPDDVIVMRLTASRPGMLNGRVHFKSLLQSTSSAVGPVLLLTGKAPKHSLPGYVRTEPGVVYSDVDGEGMHFAAVCHVQVDGGRLEALADGGIGFGDASEVRLVVGCATGFRNFAVPPDRALPEVVAKARMTATKAAGKPYQELRSAHVEDYRRLFRRVELKLSTGGEDAPLPTNQRVDSFGKNPDPALAALLFHFGRYLLIASSRPGSQPANLQGIWSAELRPAWSCTWTTNINTQMNYWLAETCNLSECHLPLLGMIQDLSVNGSRTAEVNYGTAGWCAHHNVDMWRQSAPVGDGQPWVKPTWANWCMAGVWLSSHLWEHYQFTGDLQYLREVAYPVMKGSAEFCAGWLIDDGQGGLTTCPSLSPENSFFAPNGKPADVSAGTTMDMALIREIFGSCTEAGELLGIDGPFRERLASLTRRLRPYRVGHYGQLEEWYLDFDEPNPGMGHMSHLYPLYPGSEITPLKTPELARAAQTSLEHRLSNHTKGPFGGWPGTWATALWARLGNGDQAWERIEGLLNHSMNGNLLNDGYDTHPAAGGGVRRPTPSVLFQVDTNLGVTGALAEMLLQSHEGRVAFLPALPAAWRSGSLKGLRARRGVQTDIVWREGGRTTATAQVDGEGIYRFAAPPSQELTAITRRSGGRRVPMALPAGDRKTFELNCQRGERYTFTFIKV